MALYVKQWPDGMIEVIFLKSGFRKRRYHFLVNPRDLTQITSVDGDVNYESVSYIVVFETAVSEPDLLDKVLDIAEWINKPVITDHETFDILKGMGMSVRQWRNVETLDEILDEVELAPIHYMKKDFDPENETVKPTRDSEVDVPYLLSDRLSGYTTIFLAPVRFISKLFLNTFKKPMKTMRKVPLIRKVSTPPEVSMDDIPEKPIYVKFSFSSRSLLVPLDDVGIKYIDKAVSLNKPDFVVLPKSRLQDVFKIPEGPKTVVVLDPDYSLPEPTTIPKAFNAQLNFDVILGAMKEWVELS